jgi:hypothetical protein
MRYSAVTDGSTPLCAPPVMTERHKDWTEDDAGSAGVMEGDVRGRRLTRAGIVRDDRRVGPGRGRSPGAAGVRRWALSRLGGAARRARSCRQR